MVGTIVTALLGMNLYSHSDLPTLTKFMIFFAAIIPTTVLALYTVILSRRIAAFMEALSSEGLTWREKFRTFRRIWRADKRAFARARRSSTGLSSGEDAQAL